MNFCIFILLAIILFKLPENLFQAQSTNKSFNLLEVLLEGRSLRELIESFSKASRKFPAILLVQNDVWSLDWN